MSNVVMLVSASLVIGGALLCVTGAIGVQRFPDFYSRIHAAGVTDTLGSALLIVGLMLQAGFDYLVLAKLLFILLFFFITIPTSSHALAKAAWLSGLKPRLGSKAPPHS